MAGRGRPSKPTARKLTEGDRADRINTGEPVPSATEVEAPTWLDADALEIWRRYAPDLIRKKVLTAWDAEAFGWFCEAAARRRRAVEHVIKEDEVIEVDVFNKNGEVTGSRLVKNPWLLVLSDADAQVVRWGSRFGLTPADRAHISIASSDDDDQDLLS